MTRGMKFVVGAATLLWAGAAAACEPVWVRPVALTRHSSAFLGRVEAVDWLRGEITVAPERTLTGTAARTRIRYNNIPLTCGWQSFRQGERVYVFDSEWAAPPDQVTFATPEKP